MNALIIRKYFKMVLSQLFNWKTIKPENIIKPGVITRGPHWTFVNPPDTFTAGSRDQTIEANRTVIWMNGDTYYQE